VLVQAGVILEELANQAEAAGWYFPLDLGARGSCQVGGNAATNAGGNRVIRFGTMRELVLGLEVALPDGRLLTMLNRVTKTPPATLAAEPVGLRSDVGRLPGERGASLRVAVALS
jgi:FAD/FMN-containing dehydrogenase